MCSSDLISRAASRPFNNGIARSRTATSGHLSRATRVASWPSPTSATIEKPSPSRRAFSASRTIKWSSARRIRVGIGQSAGAPIRHPARSAPHQGARKGPTTWARAHKRMVVLRDSYTRAIAASSSGLVIARSHAAVSRFLPSRYLLSQADRTAARTQFGVSPNREGEISDTGEAMTRPSREALPDFGRDSRSVGIWRRRRRGRSTRPDRPNS